MDKPWWKHYDPEVPRSIDYPRIPLYRLLDDSTVRHPDRPCTDFFGARLSYQQVRAFSDRLAASVRTLGIQRGDRVALLLPNSPQFIIAYYGLLKAGAVIVSLNPLANERELAFQLSDSEAETAITIPLFLDKVVSLRHQTPLKRIVYSRLADFMPQPLRLVQGVREGSLIRAATRSARSVLTDFKVLLREAPPPDFRPEPAEPGEIAALLYSGGTTGIAKGIVLSHFNCIANAHQIAAWGQLTEKERLLAVLPLFHGYGMSVNMNAALLAGGEIILVPRFNAGDVARTIQTRKPTFFTGVPTIFVALSSLPDIQRYDLSSLKGIFVGAAPLTRAIKDNFEAKTGGRMIEGYGLTEAVTGIKGNPYQGLHKLGSIGIPFPDVDMKIVS